jgi:gliding motility-associated peptidyl-prolyl isomerase
MNFSSFLVIFSLLIFFGCNQHESREPNNKLNQNFLKESADRNKKIFSNEQIMIQNAILKDSTFQYKYSSSGFWYAFKKKSEKNNLKPSKGNKVEFNYIIEDLNSNILYSEEELGLVYYQIDQEDIIPALRQGVKLLTPGEIAVYLFPSYLCYSYQGDNEKIERNQPLRITIKLVSITEN